MTKLERQKILDKIGKLWEIHPTCRLGQLIMNLTDYNDIFYVTDQDLNKKLDHDIKYFSGKEK